MAGFASNRTILELKFGISVALLIIFFASNRTILELKSLFCYSVAFYFCFLLIAPYWN